jgi:uncharacterized protein YbaR (Trm112 family)
MPERTTDVVEQLGLKVIVSMIGGVVAILFAVVLFVFQGEGTLIGLAWVLLVAGLALLGFGIYNWTELRKVHVEKVACPYCKFTNKLTEQPSKDFTCQGCYRLIPVQDGRVLPVMQVRCGFCNTLNYYSPKTEVLLCEDCNREVPISLDDSHTPKHIAFARRDDDKLYELVLVSNGGRKTEDLISALQHMLALNRNQVKQMLDELPVTLLTGIPRMKAEMLQTQLSTNDAVAEFRPIT